MQERRGERDPRRTFPEKHGSALGLSTGDAAVVHHAPSMGEGTVIVTVSSMPPRAVLLQRALRLRCPRCGGDAMFSGWLRMHPVCRSCGLKYEREPGFFLGSIYINYGLTALVTTVTYVTARFGFGCPNDWVVWPLAGFCVIFPTFFHRYARAYWLAMDLSFDRGSEDHDEWPAPPPSP